MILPVVPAVDTGFSLKLMLVDPPENEALCAKNEVEEHRASPIV
jgi:hypothetical protein